MRLYILQKIIESVYTAVKKTCVCICCRKKLRLHTLKKKLRPYTLQKIIAPVYGAEITFTQAQLLSAAYMCTMFFCSVYERN